MNQPDHIRRGLHHDLKLLGVDDLEHDLPRLYPVTRVNAPLRDNAIERRTQLVPRQIRSRGRDLGFQALLPCLQRLRPRPRALNLRC